MTQRQRPWGLFTRRIWGQRRDVKTFFYNPPNHWNCNNPPNDRNCRGEADQEFDASRLLRPSKPLPAWLHRPGRLSMLSLLSFFYRYWHTLCVRLILQWQNVRRVQSYSQDGCIEDFENSSEFSRGFQSRQKCICDTEHMFDCPEENAHRGADDIAAVVSKI